MTDEVRNELGHTKENEGTFYMTIEDFKEEIFYLGINYNTDNWHQDYFLALDDDGTEGSEGAWGFCGPSCTRYRAKVKNTSEQSNTVHVGIHTWRNRAYPYTEECKTATVRP